MSGWSKEYAEERRRFLENDFVAYMLQEDGWREADWADAALCLEKEINGRLYVMSSIYNGLVGGPELKHDEFDFSMVYVDEVWASDEDGPAGHIPGDTIRDVLMAVPLGIALAYLKDLEFASYC